MIRFRWRRHPREGQLAAYSDNELRGPERVWVAKHLEGCERCLAEAESYGRVERLLEERLAELPESLLEAAKERLLNANLDCTLDPRTRSVLFGAADASYSCRMIEEIVGRGAAPG